MGAAREQRPSRLSGCRCPPPASPACRPPELAGPVAVELAKPVREIPAANALPGGCLYEPKWDGYRLVDRPQAPARRGVWSKQGRDLTDRFPDLAAAALAQVPAGSVIDGEVVIWNGDAAGLRAAAAAHGHRGRAHRRRWWPPPRRPTSPSTCWPPAAPTSGTQRLTRRRAALEELAERWAPPLQLSPATSDPDEARRWFEDFRPAGVEGLVAKGAGTRYAPGRREWLKVKSWESTEVVAGGVIGPIGAPSQLVAGRYRDGELVVVGRTSPLSPAQSAELGRRPGAGRRHPPVARPDRHRRLRRRAALGAAHPGRPDGRGRDQRGRRPAGRRLPASAAVRARPGGPAARRPPADRLTTSAR